MTPRRSLEPASRLFKLLPRSASALAGLAAGLRTAELVGVFAAGSLASRGRVVHGIVTGAAIALVATARGWLRARLTETVRRTLFGAVVTSLLEGEVMGEPEPTQETESPVIAALFEAMRMLAASVPELAGGCAASLVITAALAALLPYPVLAVFVLAIAGASAALAVGQRSARGLSALETRAFEAVADGLSCAFRARLELVASGAELEFLRAQEARTSEWSRRARRTAQAAVLASRGPLLVAAAAAIVVLSSGFSASGPVEDEAWRLALLLGSASPAFASSARELVGVARAGSRLAPLLGALERPAGLAAGVGPKGPPRPAVVRFRQVSYRYPGARAPAVQDLDFEWRRGELLILRGANGSGKSTSFRLLLGLARPDEGAIEIDGIDLFTTDLRSWRRRVSFVPQRCFWPEAFTVREICRLTVPSVEDPTLERALEQVGLLQTLRSRAVEDPLSVRASTLSAGERQRLALARALAADTNILLLDEPDASLDAEGVRMLVDLLDHPGGRMVAMVAHSPALIARAHRLVSMGVRADEPHAELKRPVA